MELVIVPRYKLLTLITLLPPLALLKLIVYCFYTFGAKGLLCLYTMWLNAILLYGLLSKKRKWVSGVHTP